MSETNGHAEISLEDQVRAILRTPEERQAFREKWPMYDADQLKAAVAQADKDIAHFEEAIQKAQRVKREWTALIAQCEKRDLALSAIATKQ